MIFIFDFLNFLFQQFSFIFEIVAKFIEFIHTLDVLNISDWGLPSWLYTGFWIMFMIPVIFRVTQIIPVIGGFDS